MKLLSDIITEYMSYMLAMFIFDDLEESLKTCSY